MQARGVALRLAGSAITATAMLHEPTTGTRVADLRIGHLLSSGMGSADLTVPDLSFREGFQPELLTPLTFGVVAEVRGNVRGAGHIAWDAQRVTSTGASPPRRSISPPHSDPSPAVGHDRVHRPARAA